ncbi:PAS domain-containing sensor histidine kinase [Spirosoma rhododendri]|uniref:PAS domain-containing sensor histidine kinase n=1 Tax=Spirosoma rhododendri TaxID=2728024 RepID=UPI0020C1E0F8|nr:ATP-binding protein [Spirosoma rhododendri]
MVFAGLDAQGQLATLVPVVANRAAEALLNQSRVAWLSQPLEQAGLSWLSPLLYQQARRLLTTGPSSPVQPSAIESPAAPAGWIEVVSQPLGDGQHLLVSLTALTADPPSALAQPQGTRYFEALAANMPHMGVLVVNPRGTIEQAFGLLPGLLSQRQPEALPGQTLLELVLPDYRSDWERYLTTTLRGESHFFSDHWNAWRCECYVGPVPGVDGEVDGALVVFRNVTEQYRQQQALQALNQALVESNQRLERFAAVASHDLQEPLRKIQLFSQLLQQRAAGRLEAADLDRLNRMHAAARRLRELIESLLVLTQVSGPAPVKTLVDLAELTLTVISDLSVRIEEQSALVEVVPPLPPVLGDAPQLRQLFQNLLSNALKFTAPEVAPRVVIQARLVAASTVLDLGLSSQFTYVEVSVSDNGIGIGAADVTSIFGWFSRLHGRQRYEGSGLGLATVKQVLDNHGGSVRVESQLGVGTTMRVYLPVAPVVGSAES